MRTLGARRTAQSGGSVPPAMGRLVLLAVLCAGTRCIYSQSQPDLSARMFGAAGNCTDPAQPKACVDDAPALQRAILAAQAQRRTQRLSSKIRAIQSARPCYSIVNSKDRTVTRRRCGVDSPGFPTYLFLYSLLYFGRRATLYVVSTRPQSTEESTHFPSAKPAFTW